MKVNFKKNEKTVSKSLWISDERADEIMECCFKILHSFPPTQGRITQGQVLEKFFSEMDFKDSQELAFATFYIVSEIGEIDKREAIARFLNDLNDFMKQ